MDTKAIFVAIVLSLAGSVGSEATGAVISADHASFGVGAVTRDTAQGLDFLDLTFSYDRSEEEVSALLGAGQLYEGFRYATDDEVINLINNYGFSPTAVTGQQVDGDTGSDQLSGLLSLVGGVSQFAATKASGITGTVIPNSTQLRLTTFMTFDNLPNDRVLAGTISSSAKRSDIASWLVQDSAVNSVVPEPNSMTLGLIAAVLLGYGARRRRRGAEATAN